MPTELPLNRPSYLLRLLGAPHIEGPEGVLGVEWFSATGSPCWPCWRSPRAACCRGIVSSHGSALAGSVHGERTQPPEGGGPCRAAVAWRGSPDHRRQRPAPRSIANPDRRGGIRRRVEERRLQAGDRAVHRPVPGRPRVAGCSGVRALAGSRTRSPGAALPQGTRAVRRGGSPRPGPGAGRRLVAPTARLYPDRWPDNDLPDAGSDRLRGPGSRPASCDTPCEIARG